jgi:hypothetical protein
MNSQIPGFQTVCSYLAVKGATGQVEFLCSAFPKQLDVDVREDPLLLALEAQEKARRDERS